MTMVSRELTGVRFLTALLIALLTIPPAPAFGAEYPSQANKVSAEAQIVPGEPRVVVQITNKSEVSIEAWQVRLAYVGLNGAPSSVDVTTDTYAVFEGPSLAASGPIPPGTARSTSIWLGVVPRSASVELRMVVYSDLSVDGDHDAATQVFSRRERDAQALDILLSALQPAAGRSNSQARSVLRSGLAARGAELDQLSSSESSVKGLEETVNELLSAPDSDFSKRLSYLQQHFAKQKALAVRHRGRK